MGDRSKGKLKPDSVTSSNVTSQATKTSQPQRHGDGVPDEAVKEDDTSDQELWDAADAPVQSKPVDFISRDPETDSNKLVDAAKKQDSALFRKILETSRSLNINKTDNTGKSSVHYLSKSSMVAELQLFLRLKPKVNTEDSFGWTPLHYAAINGHGEVISLLVANGADPNKTDKNMGRSPLHIAVKRKNNAIAERLVECGADPSIKDATGKSVTEICASTNNSHLLEKLEDACETKEMQIGNTSVEANEVPAEKPAPFANFNVVITQKPRENAEVKPFKMTMKKISPDSIGDTFHLSEMEDICSDAFNYTVRGTSGPTIVDINVPIVVTPTANEEILLKDDYGDEILIDNFLEEDEKWFCVATVDVTALNSFIIVSRPKVEKFPVGLGKATIKSSVDERVELDIPKGTFEKPVTISMEITETPKEDGLDQVMTECTEISSTTAFYSLESETSELSKPICVKIPLPEDFSGDLDRLAVLSMDDALEKEGPNAWNVVDVPMRIVHNRVEFEVTHFCIKVAVERRPSNLSQISDGESNFGSAVTIGSQVSKLFRKSRKREHAVSFICASRRVGTSNTFKIITKCCKVEQFEEKSEALVAEGFEIHQLSKKPSNTSDELKVLAKQKFRVTSKTHTILGDADALFVEFHPKVDTHKAFTITIDEKTPISNGDIEVFLVKKKNESSTPTMKDGDERNQTEVNEDKVYTYDVCFMRFDPKMIDRIDGRSFLSYKRMVQLEQDIGDVWWKALILMGVPFKTIEETFLETGGSVPQKVNGLLFDWKEQHRSSPSRGIDLLLSALCRSSRRALVTDLTLELQTWKNDQKNRKDSFYSWLVMAYKHDLLIPTHLGKPMSDVFLAMVADRLDPTLQFASALNLPSGAASDMLKNTAGYPTAGLRCMKLFDMARKAIPDQVLCLRTLLEALKSLGLMEDVAFVVMLTRAWIKRQSNPKQEQKMYSFLDDIVAAKMINDKDIID